MKVYTYENPFMLNRTSFWDEIKDYCHLCVSQTLVEGLKARYKRRTFQYLDTIDGFIRELYKPWADDIENMIEQFVMLSEEIQKIENDYLRRSFKFTKREVHEALRFLVELKVTPDSIKNSGLTKEQLEFLRIYKNLYREPKWNTINELIASQDRSDVKTAVINRLIDEVENKSGMRWDKRRTPFAFIDEAITDQSKKQFYLQLLENYEREEIHGFVLHGVHQFTPMILRLVEHLRDLGFEVVFLIQMDLEHQRIYETWKRVYQWCQPTYIHNTEKYAYNERSLGKAIGDLLESKVVDRNQKVSFFQYENLTEFVNRIANVFQKTLDKDPPKRISAMKEQFYVVDNELTNELLKGYFPDQFTDRHFLSYPIGQFIMALYRMWDPESKSLVLTPEVLKEALSAPFLGNIKGRPILQIYRKIELYLKGITNYDEAIERLSILKLNLEKIEKNEEYSDLKRFSFYHISIEDVDAFKQALRELKSIAAYVFRDMENGKIRFRDHFRRLISTMEVRMGKTEDLQTYFIQGLKERFENRDQLEISASFDDLRESIHYYLKVNANEEQRANWICRNFEQLDGAVLMSNNAKDNGVVYQIGQLSDEQMNVTTNQLLKWPLDESFFEGYEGDSDSLNYVHTVLTCKREYKNFLRYSLYYVCRYAECEVELSYIYKEGEEKRTPYYILDLLGLDPKRYEEISHYDFVQFAGEPFHRDPDQPSDFPLHLDALQSYAICDYRYFHNHLLMSADYFSNELHCRYYYRSILLDKVWRRLAGKRYENESELEQDLEQILDEEHKMLSSFVPFWGLSDLFDLREQTLDDLNKQRRGIEFKPVETGYVDIRKRFLIAEINPYNNRKENLLKNVHKLRSDRSNIQGREELIASLKSSIIDYMELPSLKMKSVNENVCNYCNLRDMCLEHFKADTQNKEEVEIL
ncbi:hypothetical protein PRECH8_04870 [Insulibacter thermoxylanivorax]|uniref:Uncharacterized protein n=1 Tax=Insulibacter thermoxylanivorax TaxID=2749268 RepID=A0A916VFB5_9BACL|nr:hypothetical protein [Insulibacter thermoxylanivorax]GFR37191.1 hypothetical protein PRECH8_04870 [Insulibacter thermoxylanivorax]